MLVLHTLLRKPRPGDLLLASFHALFHVHDTGGEASLPGRKVERMQVGKAYICVMGHATPSHPDLVRLVVAGPQGFQRLE